MDESSASGKSHHHPSSTVIQLLWMLHYIRMCTMTKQTFFLVSSAGDRQHPPGGPLLPGSGTGQHLTQNPPGWHPHLRHQAVLLGRQPAPLQHPHVSPHVRHQPAQAAPEAARYTDDKMETPTLQFQLVVLSSLPVYDFHVK